MKYLFHESFDYSDKHRKVSRTLVNILQLVWRNIGAQVLTEEEALPKRKEQSQTQHLFENS